MKKNLSKSVFSIYFIALSFFAYSQTGGGVSINNSNAPAHPSAMLDVSSTSAPYMGMLIPRMSTANRNAITLPATGLQIFNTDCGVNEYYTGTCWVSMGQNLKAPDPITCSGTTDFCANETRTFTIPIVNGATGYQWTEPSGATITSGQGTTSVTIVFGNNSGEVCVTAGSLCETSPSRCKSIHINPVPLAPGNITGPTTMAPGTNASFFIAAVAGASLYNWTVPSGATITSGVGTTTITVNFSCSAASGNVSVTAQNNCGSSLASTLAVALTPVTANAGPSTTSPGTLGGLPTASGGTLPYTYAWAPSTNLSGTTVANPTTTVCTTTTYTVTVTDVNGCTARSSTTASVTNPIPATPGSITGNTNIACNALSGNVYSIITVPAATTYTWTLPSGASITGGQNTTSITVTFGASSGNISVTAGNNCGTSFASTLAVTVASGGGPGTQTFGYTGSVQTFTVPSCIASLTVETWGAQGGGTGGGLGGYSTGVLNVTPAEVLNVYVGGRGASGTTGILSGGYNGGGNGYYGSAGGGASDVRQGGTALSNRIIVAGGGGGYYNGTAGTGGGATGGNSSSSGFGTGGSQSSGGNYCGSFGQGGNNDNYNGGGGGGGYYGGGANWCTGSPSSNNGSGGGGSGYTGGVSGSSMQNGIRSGDGQVKFTW